jgi:hypothetical protein
MKIVRGDDAAAAVAPYLLVMKRKLLFLLLVTGLIMLALGGWAVDGVRWAVAGGAIRALAPRGTAPAPA